MDLKRPSKVARKSVKNRHWHILKIDAEGYENKILSGSYNTILDNRPVCIVEMDAEFLKRNSYLEGHRQTFFRHFVNLEYKLFDLRTNDYVFFPIEMR